MNNAKHKQMLRTRRRIRIRSRVIGSAECPRLSIFRSAKHMSVQLIDDSLGRTIASASDKELKAAKKTTKTEQALAVGKLIAEKAATLKVTRVVFDRGGYQYHGRVKAVADGAREGGLQF